MLILVGLSLVVWGPSYGAAWYLPETKDDSVAEASAAIEQARYEDALRILESDDIVKRLATNTVENGRRLYLRAWALAQLGRTRMAIDATGAALSLPGFLSGSADQGRVALLRSCLFFQVQDWASAFANVSNARVFWAAKLNSPHPARIVTTVAYARALSNVAHEKRNAEIALESLTQAQR